MHDWWLALIGAAVGKIELIDGSTAFYRQHSSNTLGARKWKFSFRRFIDDQPREISSTKPSTVIHEYFSQADLLYERIRDVVPNEQEILLTAFINLQFQGWIRKRISLIRYQFVKSNVIKILVYSWGFDDQSGNFTFNCDCQS